MFTLKTHLGIYVFAILICNFVELCHQHSYNNKTCSSWYIPTVAAIILGTIAEVFLWVGYYFFFMKPALF